VRRGPWADSFEQKQGHRPTSREAQRGARNWIDELNAVITIGSLRLVTGTEQAV
jgi:hypothetical protein